MTRVEPFTTVHKGVRLLLFDVTTAAAKLELGSDSDVDLLVDAIDRALELVEEHERTEAMVVVPVLGRLDPSLARRIAAGHLEIEALASAVRRKAHALASAAGDERARNVSPTTDPRSGTA